VRFARSLFVNLSTSLKKIPTDSFIDRTNVLSRVLSLNLMRQRLLNVFFPTRFSLQEDIARPFNRRKRRSISHCSRTRREWGIPNLAPNSIHTFIRDLIGCRLKFTRAATMKVNYGLTRPRESRDRELQASLADRSQFSETFSICPALPSGLSGKKSIPVSAPTRFNSGAL